MVCAATLTGGNGGFFDGSKQGDLSQGGKGNDTVYSVGNDDLADFVDCGLGVDTANRQARPRRRRHLRQLREVHLIASRITGGREGAEPDEPESRLGRSNSFRKTLRQYAVADRVVSEEQGSESSGRVYERKRGAS